MQYRNGLLIGLILTTTGLFVVGGTTSDKSFSLYNNDWDGSSEFRTIERNSSGNIQILIHADEYRSFKSNDSLSLIISPEQNYSPQEVSYIKDFVKTGGTLIVADDFGRYSNDLLNQIGADARINGSLLRDDVNFQRSSGFPISTVIASHSIVSGVQNVTLNYGTIVEPNGAEVFIASSKFSYLDINRNGEIDENEDLGSYPIMTKESIGKGVVIVVADPSIFTNSMLDRSGNKNLLIRVFNNYDTIIVDHSNVDRLPPIVAAVKMIRLTPVYQVIIGSLIICLVFGYEILSSIRRQPFGQQSENRKRLDVGESMQNGYPNWDTDYEKRIAEKVRSAYNTAHDRRQ